MRTLLRRHPWRNRRHDARRRTPRRAGWALLAGVRGACRSMRTSLAAQLHMGVRRHGRRVPFWLWIAEGNAVQNDAPIAEIVEIAASTVPLMERARGLVESIDGWLPVDAIWLTLSDPQSQVYATVGSAGLERPILQYLDRPTVAREIQLAELNQDRPPVAATELPVPVEELPTWAE